MKALFPASLLLAVLGAPHAQDQSRWSLVGVAHNGMVIRYDQSTMHRSGDTVTLWVRYDFAKDPPVINGQAAQYSLRRESYSCGAMLNATYSAIYYTADGGVISSQVMPALEYTAIIPESVAEQTWSVICKAP